MIKYRCPKCGDVFEGRLEYCPNCHVKFKFADKNVPNEEESLPEVIKEEKQPEEIIEKLEEKVEEKEPELPAEQKPEEKSDLVIGPSYFDGKTIQRIGWFLLGSLISIVTLFILSPILTFFLLKWERKHSVVDGHRLEFRGKFGGYWGRCIGLTFLTIFTLGFYLPFGLYKLENWKQERTFVADIKGESEFTGNKYHFVGLRMINTALTICTLGVYGPVASVNIMNWQFSNSLFSGKQLKFVGDKYEYVGKNWVWFIISFFTLGIFTIFLPVRTLKWKYSQIHFE